MSKKLEEKFPHWVKAWPGISASNFAAILGEDPFASHTEAMQRAVTRALDKVSVKNIFSENRATQHGHTFEASALYDLSLLLSSEDPNVGTILNAGADQLQIHCTYKNMRLTARPDGLVAFKDKWYLIEVKCPFNRSRKTLAEQEHYKLQVQMQLFCANRTDQFEGRKIAGAIYYEWFQDELNNTYEMVEYDEKVVQERSEEMKSFWTKLNGILADRALADQWVTAVHKSAPVDEDIEEYLRLDAESKVINKKKNEIKKRIMERHGDDNIVFYDEESKARLVSYKAPRSGLSITRLKKALNEILAECEDTSTSDMMKVITSDKDGKFNKTWQEVVGAVPTIHDRKIPDEDKINANAE